MESWNMNGEQQHCRSKWHDVRQHPCTVCACGQQTAMVGTTSQPAPQHPANATPMVVATNPQHLGRGGVTNLPTSHPPHHPNQQPTQPHTPPTQQTRNPPSAPTSDPTTPPRAEPVSHPPGSMPIQLPST